MRLKPRSRLLSGMCDIRSAAPLLVRLSRRRSGSRALGLDKPLSSGAQAKVDALRAAKAHWQSRQEQELQAKARERCKQELQRAGCLLSRMRVTCTL